jgi:hypothetical protein
MTRIVSLQRVVLSALVCLVTASASAAPKAPGWYKKPRSDSATELYQVGIAEKCKTRQEAQGSAFTDALRKHANRISVSIWSVMSDRVEEKNDKLTSSTKMRIDAAANHQLIGTDLVEESIVEYRGKWYAWVQVSYPKVQYQKALARVEAGVKDGGAGADGRIPLLVCPVAFGERSAEQFPEIVAGYQKKGYGNAIWQSVEDKLYDTGRYRIVTPPSKQIKSVLEQILSAKAEESGKQELPSKILLCNMNFFEVKSEKLRFGTLARKTEYHVELMLEYYDITGPYTNVKIPARGEAKKADLLEATNMAAEQAIEKLLERIAMEK